MAQYILVCLDDEARNYHNKGLYDNYDNDKYLGNKENPYIVLVEITDKSITSYTTHLSRLDRIGDKDLKRVEKYQAAIAILTE